MRRACSFALATAVVLGGCAGHGTSPLPPAATKPQSAPVAFTMHWPTAASSSARTPQYISPSTKSVVVEVNNDPALTTIANNPGGGASTISLQAPVGSDDFIISLYDQPQTAGETKAVGNELGQVEVVQSIDSGKTNTVSATVNGIAARLAVAALPNQSFVQNTGSASEPKFSIVGENAAQFTITPQDADGNAIVGTGIVPTVSFHASVSTTNLTVVPDSSDPQRFSVSPTQASAAASNTLIAQATDAMGSTVSLNVPVTEVSELFVSYPTATGSKISAYDTSGNPIPLPAGAFAGLQNPTDLVYDDANNQLLVGDAALEKVFAFDAQGNPKSGFTPVSVPGLVSIALDTKRERIVALGPATATIVTSKDGGAVNEPFTTTPFTISQGAGAVYFPQLPSSWVGDEYILGNTALQQLDIYAPSGIPTWSWPPSYSLSPAGTASAIATDGQGLYITGSASGSATIWQIPINSGTYTSVTDAGGPAGIACDPLTGDVFVAESLSNTIAAYKSGLSADPAHTFATPSSSGLSAPQGVAVAY